MGHYMTLQQILNKPKIILDETYTYVILLASGHKIFLKNMTYDVYIPEDDTYEFGNDYDAYVYSRKIVLGFKKHKEN